MGWPKGLKRKQESGRLPENGATTPMPTVKSPKVDTLNGFQTGQWYAPTEAQPIKVNASGQLYRHTVIKFKVVKITGDIVAVQFEDGTFEAMITPEFDKYTVAQAPKY